MPATMDRAVKLAVTVDCAGRHNLNATEVQVDWALCSEVPPET